MSVRFTEFVVIDDIEGIMVQLLQKNDNNIRHSSAKHIFMMPSVKTTKFDSYRKQMILIK